MGYDDRLELVQEDYDVYPVEDEEPEEDETLQMFEDDLVGHLPEESDFVKDVYLEVMHLLYSPLYSNLRKHLEDTKTDDSFPCYAPTSQELFEELVSMATYSSNKDYYDDYKEKIDRIA